MVLSILIYYLLKRLKRRRRFSRRLGSLFQVDIEQFLRHIEGGGGKPKSHSIATSNPNATISTITDCHAQERVPISRNFVRRYTLDEEGKAWVVLKTPSFPRKFPENKTKYVNNNDFN